jgi:membrane dipeptidase
MSSDEREQTLRSRAQAIHDAATVIDGLTVGELTRERFGALRAGGVTAINWTAGHYFTTDLDALIVALARGLENIQGLSECFISVKTAGDIDRAKREGKVGVILGMQNPSAVRERLEVFWLLQAVGVRIVQLTYNERNFIGDGCLEPENAGLSRYGRRVVRTLNHVGILIDLSHCGLRTTREAIDLSDKPVAITHSNPSSLVPNARNKSDEILKALGERGGVLGLCVWAPLAARPKGNRPTLSEFVDMVHHVVTLAGVDHVGIGTDFGDNTMEREEFDRTWGLNGLYPEITGALGSWYQFDAQTVEGLHSTALLGNLTEELLRHSFDERDIRKILGGNFRRLFGDVWR